MSDSTENDVVLEIYKSANDPQNWLNLLEKLYCYISEQDILLMGSPAVCQVAEKSTSSIEEALQVLPDDFSLDEMIEGNQQMQPYKLLKHFSEALKIIKHIHDKENFKKVVELLLDRMPIGVMLFNNQGQVIFYNRISEKLCEYCDLVQITSSYHLVFNNPSITEWLDDSFKNILASADTHASYSQVFTLNDKDIGFSLCKATTAQMPAVLFLSTVNNLIPADEKNVTRYVSFFQKRNTNSAAAFARFFN